MAPDLLHVDDPDFSNSKPIGTNSQSSRLLLINTITESMDYGECMSNRNSSTARLERGPHSSLQDPRQHKIHRNIVNPLFSQRSVNTLSTMAQEKLENAVRIIKTHQFQGKPFDIQRLYRCISV